MLTLCCLRSAVRVAFAATTCLTATSTDASPAGQPATTTAIRAISTASSGSTALVTIEASGPLPTPSAGVVDGPPRIYVDFAGVALRAPARIASTDPRIRRIRTGVNSVKPLVTRVVIDLHVLLPYRVERAPGRIVIVVGSPPLSAGIPPVPALPDPPRAVPVDPAPVPPPAPGPVAPPPGVRRDPATPTTPPPAPPPMPFKTPAAPADLRPTPTTSGQPLPLKDLEKYRRQVSPTLDRLRLQEPFLASLDTVESPSMDRVQLAVEEFDRLRQELAAVRPPDSLRAQHDMLMQSTTLAQMATRLRLEAFRTLDPATVRNAGSAAAGAILLLDRVCGDLGCNDSGR